MRILIQALLKEHLTNRGFAADDPVVRTIHAVGIDDCGDCWVDVEDDEGEVC